MFYFRTPVFRLKRITRFYLKHIDMYNKWVWGVFIIEMCLHPYLIYSVCTDIVTRCYHIDMLYIFKR